MSGFLMQDLAIRKMREPSLETDGWHLLDGEEQHRLYPATFLIPSLRQRKGIQIGDVAKLMFEIAVSGEEGDRLVVERMWVIVTARVRGGYIGVLDNDPCEIDENDELWSGTELPFAPKHIISIRKGDEASVEYGKRALRRPWS